MRYPRTETAEKHERILEAAGRLLRERGMTGVSVAEIMKAAGLTHGPFYHHFASKEALVAESIETISASAIKDMQALAPDAEGRASFIAGYLSLAHRDDPGRGCPLAALGPEGAREPVVRSALGRHLKASLDALTAHFPWPGRSPTRGEAIHTLAAMVGAMILARSTDDEVLRGEILDEVRRRH